MTDALSPAAHLLAAAEHVEAANRQSEFEAQSCAHCRAVHYRPRAAFERSLELTRLSEKLRRLARAEGDSDDTD